MLQIPIDPQHNDFHKLWFSKRESSLTEEEFFTSLDQDMVLKLYHYYQRDFVIFGYNDTANLFLSMNRMP